MANNCYCQTSCAGISIVSGIIIGIITAMLDYIAVITVTPAFSYVLFGIAVVYLGISLVASNLSCNCTVNRCMCLTIPVYFIGILGTILTSIILLGVRFSAASVIGAVISGLLLGFFTLIMTSAVCLIKCKTLCSND